MIALLSDSSLGADWGAYAVDQHRNLVTVGSLVLQVAIDGDAVSSGVWATSAEQDGKMA